LCKITSIDKKKAPVQGAHAVAEVSKIKSALSNQLAQTREKLSGLEECGATAPQKKERGGACLYPDSSFTSGWLVS
jgi:hypothetical protein